MTALQHSALRARFDAESTATLSELTALHYERVPDASLPAHVRAASALRRVAARLVIVQDDVDALVVRDADGGVHPVLLPARPSGARTFDDAAGNKHDKLDLEACVVLGDGRFVAFGSGAAPVRESLVVWHRDASPVTVRAPELYARLRAAVTDDTARLNVEGAVASATRLLLFHRGNDAPRSATAAANAIVELDLREFVRWLDGTAAAPRVVAVTSVDLGAVGGVRFGFTDAAALGAERVVVLACAEDSACAITDGAVVGARVGVLDEHGLRMVDVCDAGGERTRLKLEGVEPQPGSDFEFDVVIDVDRVAVPAQLGRLVWRWR